MVLEGKISRLWRVLLRPDAGVSDDELVCHHPISQPIKLVMARKIHLRRRYVLNGIPYIEYPRPQ